MIEISSVSSRLFSIISITFLGLREDSMMVASTMAPFDSAESLFSLPVISSNLSKD